MKNTYYFPHEYHARHDPKLEKLLFKMGCEGLGIYWCIVEILYEQGGYINIEDVEFLAHSIKSDIKKLTEVINNYGLFNKNGTKFYSETVLTRLSNMLERRKQMSVASNIMWDKYRKRKAEKEERGNYKALRKENNPEKKTYIQFVKLLESEHASLVLKLGNKNLDKLIENLNNYIGSTGRRYKSHYHTLLTWAKKDKIKKPIEEPKSFKKEEINEEGLKQIHNLSVGLIKDISGRKVG